MSTALREAVRDLLEKSGWVVHRWPTTRFEGMRQALQLLRRRGYEPSTVIDCGSNLGQWFHVAESVFPAASYHLIEPQPRCVEALERLRATRPRVSIHATALTLPGVTTVRMLGSGDGTGTGNFVANPGETHDDESNVRATTLDELLAATVSKNQRALLKLDVERHEVAVLRGAVRLLPQIEVVLSETGVYDVGNKAVFADLMSFMYGSGFEFYDIACLSGRPRDKRLRQMDVIFVRGDSALVADHDWE